MKSKALTHPKKNDLETTHEEEDVILPQQVVALADMGCNIINIICDDTYICVCTTLPLLSVSLIMEPTSRSRSSIAIGATVAKHSGIVSQLITAHAISGCHKLGCYLGTGKTKVIKAWSAGIELNHLGDPNASLDDAMKESTHLIGQVMDRVRSVRHNVFSPLQGIGITHWAKGGQYPSGAKISSAWYGSL